MRKVQLLPGVVLVLAVLVEIPTAAVEAELRESRRDRMAQVESAWVGGRTDELLQHVKFLETHDGSSRAADYDLAYASWRLDLLGQRRSAQGSLDPQLIERAQALLEALVESGPENTESLILLSALIGVRANESAFSRVSLGWRAHRLLAESLELEPDNLRGLLQQAIVLFHTPASFGGGPDKAAPILERLRQRFNAQEENTPWPSWGRYDTAAWLGQSLARMHREQEARTVYLEALEQEPDNRWIRDSLLPALGQRSSATRWRRSALVKGAE